VKKLFVSFLIILIFLFNTAVFAQYSKQLQRISPDEGLSQTSVSKTIQDNLGYIWIATELGLNRSDGNILTTFPGPNDIFDSESIVTLYKDNKGMLWVSTAFSGLFRINPQTLETKQLFKGKFNPTDEKISMVDIILEDNQDNLWLGVSTKLIKYNLKTNEQTVYLTLKSDLDFFRDLLLKDNFLYIATSKGLYQLNTLTNRVQLIEHRLVGDNSIDSNNTKLLKFDEQLGLLVGSVEGLYQLNINEFGVNPIIKPKKIIPLLNIWDMSENDKGYFVATEQGLFQFDSKTSSMTPLLKFSNSQYQINEDTILDIFEDKTGLLWLSSRTQGVFTWLPQAQRFKNYNAFSEPSLSHDMVWSNYQDENGILWVGTDNGLNKLNLVDNKNTAYLMTQDKKAVNGLHTITHIFPGIKNYLWLLTADGLKYFNKQTGKVSEPNFNERTLNILKTETIYTAEKVSQNQFILITDSNYYIYNIEDGSFELLEALTEYAPVDLAYGFLKPLPNKPNTLLLAYSGHLYQYNLITKEVSLIYQVKNYQPQTYNYVDNWVIHNDVLWLSVSGEGLIGLDKNTFKELYRFDTSNKLPSNKIYSLALGENNDLWFSSQVGLFQLSLTNFNLKEYTVKEGLPANEFNGYGVTELKNGRLAFSSTRGLVTFSPKDFSKEKLEHDELNVSITGITLLSRELAFTPDKYLDQPVMIQHDDFGIDIFFSIFVHKSINRVRYHIEVIGPDELTFNNLKKSHINFSKLAPGKHTISISATDPNTGFRTEPVTLKVNVAYPPWQKPWVKVLYVVIFILLVSIFYVRRVKLQHKAQKAHKALKIAQEETALALENSHSGIWTYLPSENKWIDKRVSAELGFPKSDTEFTLKSHIKLVHPDDTKTYTASWLAFIGGDIPQWQATYRMQNFNGNWVWFRETGKIASFDENNKPNRFSGTYTNITDTKANEFQAQIYGEAFAQINDWLLILDINKQLVSANASFLQSFNLYDDDLKTMLTRFIKSLTSNAYKKYTKIFDSLDIGGKYSCEDLVVTEQFTVPILVSINCVSSDDGRTRHFVIIISDLTIQKESEEKLKKLANFDHLTKIPNRTLMLDRINQAIIHSKNQNHTSALFFIDLDRFKPVNDTFGHSIGDQLLKIVTQRLSGLLSNDDCIGRQSGDEFIILIEQFASPDELTHLAIDINQLLAQPVTIENYTLNITASIGIAVYPFDAQNAEELIQNSDIAMIHAKQTGKNGFRFFTDEMNHKAKRRMTFEAQLKSAVQCNDLINHYQPIINTKDKSVCGVELLLRWPTHNGMVSPGIFIPIAEEISLITEITEQALIRVLNEFSDFLKLNPKFYISINLSAIHILRSDLTNSLMEIIKPYNISPRQFRLEITESILMDDKNRALEQLNKLKQAGFRLFLDDFGTGFSSLTYLSQFPIDVIKIDQSFVRDIGANKVNESIIKTILTLAKNLEIYCVAEGVETREQIHFLIKQGCTNFQGYYFDKPMSYHDLIESGRIQNLINEIRQV